MNLAFATTTPLLGLYPVVDSVTWIERLLSAGVKTIQLRIKDKTAEQAETAIMQAIMFGQDYQARLFINDFWQLAVKHQAYGVHLGQEDLDRADLEAIRNARLRLGISTHNDVELARAVALKPSYIAIGHIFQTQTKKMSSAPQGVSELKRQIDALQGRFPTVAIGGISIDHTPSVLATGIGSIAVVSAITQAADWRQATATLLSLIENQEGHNA